MNKTERENRDRMIYSMHVEFLSDGLTLADSKREIARQMGLSLKVVQAAIVRHVCNIRSN